VLERQRGGAEPVVVDVGPVGIGRSIRKTVLLMNGVIGWCAMSDQRLPDLLNPPSQPRPPPCTQPLHPGDGSDVTVMRHPSSHVSVHSLHAPSDWLTGSK